MPWYETNLFGVIIGAVISIVIFFLSQYFTNISEKKKNRQNIILLITQSNASLFSIIYKGSLNKDKIDYIKLRSEIEKSNILFVLPDNIRKPFEELYKIHLMDELYYRENKHRIHSLLEKIVIELKRYGVDFD